MNWYSTYILASKRNGTLYTGVTNDLAGRVRKHKDGVASRFTLRYRVRTLVYYEMHNDIYAAIQREKQLKKWKRGWKIELIEKHNPKWLDLYGEDGVILPLPRE
jgi:putative endonuclease